MQSQRDGTTVVDYYPVIYRSFEVRVVSFVQNVFEPSMSWYKIFDVAIRKFSGSPINLEIIHKIYGLVMCDRKLKVREISSAVDIFEGVFNILH